MIPFSSFMPAGDMITDMGGKAFNGAGAMRKGSEEAGVESGSPFLTWVLKSMGRLESMGCLEEIGAEVQLPIGLDQDGSQAESYSWDQLVALMANATQPADEAAEKLPNLTGNGIGILSGFVQALETIDPEEGAAGDPGNGSNRRSLPDLLNKIGVGQSKPDPEGTPPRKLSDAQIRTGSDSVHPDTPGKTAGSGEGNQFKVALLSNETQAKEPDSKPIRTIAQFGGPEPALVENGQEEKNTTAFIKRSGPAVRMPASGSDKSASVDTFPLTGKGLTATANGQADYSMATQEEEPGQFRETVRNGLPTRHETAENHEKEEFKGVNLDAGKGTGSETHRTVDTLQAAFKAPLTGKTAPTPPPVMTRMEAPAAGAFQTAVMDQIVEKISLRNFQGRSEMQIRLKPEFLGNVQMHIVADKEQMVVRMVTDQAAVKEIVESNLHQLKAELQNQGLSIDRFDILVNPDAEQHPNRDQFAQMFRQAPSQNEQRRDRNPEADTDPQDNGSRTDEDQPDKDGINYFA